MFNVFKKAKAISQVGKLLKTDIHAHWLPEIDDGAPNMDTTLEMLKIYMDLGYERVIATPHIYQDYYPNTWKRIESTFNEVKIEALKHDITLSLEFAAEYYLDNHFVDLLANNELLTFGTNKVLVEQSFFSEHPDTRRIFFDMQIKGYQPILAHVERYGFYSKNLTLLKQLKDEGVLFQLNMGSLIGKYGKEVQQQAEFLIKNGLIDFFATDAHKKKDLIDLKVLKVKNPNVLYNKSL